MDTASFLQGLSSYIRHSDPAAPIGRDGRIRVNYFLDLMGAVHNAQVLDQLTKQFADYLASFTPVNSYDGIASPKRGNALLAYRTANRLGKRFCFVKEQILFGRWIEGNIGSGDKVLLIDDIASDGELLAETAEALQRAGIFVDRIAALVSRAEGDTERIARSMALDFQYLFQISDDDLCRGICGAI